MCASPLTWPLPPGYDKAIAIGLHTCAGSKQDTSDLDVDGEDEAALITSRLPPPGIQRSNLDGMFEFCDLLLPSAPASYRPFLLEDEVLSTHSSTATGSTSSLRRGPKVPSEKVCFVFACRSMLQSSKLHHISTKIARIYLY